jgi:hypothetical protein
MIADRGFAIGISELMLDFPEWLNRGVADAAAVSRRDELLQYRRTIGEVLADMLWIMNPLYRVHPDLKPPGLA